MKTFLDWSEQEHKGHRRTHQRYKSSSKPFLALRHTWTTRAAEAGMDMPTLAALLGHSKLNMVMRYAHPQEKHQADSVKKLEAFNVAKEIAEVEKQKNRSQAPVSQTVPTVPENPTALGPSKTEGKSQ